MSYPWIARAATVALLGTLACGPAGTGGAGQPAPAPERVAYAPFAARYEVASHGQVRQEPPGAPPWTATFELRYFLTARVDRAESGLTARLLIDSIPVLRGSEFAAMGDDARRAEGATFTSPLTPEGRLTDFQGSQPMNALLEQMSARLGQFFARLPAGGATPGVTWTDTSSLETESAGIALTVESVNRHEALAWSERDGTPALHIRTVSDYTVSGGGAQSGQDIAVDGAGVRSSDQYLAPDGRYVLVTTADSTDLTATVVTMGMAVPITQTRSDTLRLLP